MISIFTTVKDAYERGDTYTESIECYKELADEVVVMNGGLKSIENYDNVRVFNKYWPTEFKWPFIGQQFTRGYRYCSGDWVIHCDLDMIFHQKDFGKIRQALIDYPSSPAISFYKWQFILPSKYNLKSRLLLAVNKGAYGDRITFSGGGDLCQPQLDGKDLDLNEMPQSGVPFYNYEKITKTKEQIMDDQGRMERAYFRHFGRYQLAQDGTDQSAYDGWLRMQYGRFNKPQEHIRLDAHPRYMIDTINNLTPDQWGYSGFGGLGLNDYAKNKVSK